MERIPGAPRGFVSRKFIVVVVALLCATFLTYEGIMPVDTYADLVKWLLGAYVIAEGGADIVSRSRWSRAADPIYVPLSTSTVMKS